jgi:hypothetical protein
LQVWLFMENKSRISTINAGHDFSMSPYMCW